MHLMRILAQLSVALRHKDEINTEISEASVAWHIDHSLRVINAVYDTLQNSEPEDYKSEENPIKSYVLNKKHIKRGIAKAPAHVLPLSTIHPDGILDELEKAKKAIILFDTLHKKNFFQHHSMGVMKTSEAKKFLKIHTQHHLSIINDILESNNITTKKQVRELSSLSTS
ncbi:MAG: hypothetical protein ABJH05_17645 [Fulvivirga sp.]